MLKELFGPRMKYTLVDAAVRDVSSMLQQSARMLYLALDALLEDKQLDVDLDDMDDIVDEGERMVRRTILEHLSVNPRQDLVASLVLVSMVQDAERIGDFASGLKELLQMAKGPRTGPFVAELRALGERLRPLFELAETAFREDDSEKARQVIAAYHELRDQLKAYRERIAESDLSADMAMLYAGSAQILRRVGAHLCNIASTVVQPYDRMRHGDEEVV